MSTNQPPWDHHIHHLTNSSQLHNDTLSQSAAPSPHTHSHTHTRFIRILRLRLETLIQRERRVQFTDADVDRLSSAALLHPPLLPPQSAAVVGAVVVAAAHAPMTPTAPSTPSPTSTATKRSTDHSINSIISSSPVPQTTHSATPSPTLQQQQPPQPAAATPLSISTTITAVGRTAPNSTPSPAAQHGDGDAVAAVGLRLQKPSPTPSPSSVSSLSHHNVTPPPAPAPPSSAVEELLSSDSDDVEFVGECDPIDTMSQRQRQPEMPAPPKGVQINRNKYAKRPVSADESPSAADYSNRSNSPKVMVVDGADPAAAAGKSFGGLGLVSGAAEMADSSAKADDLDVAQIMSALKELQVNALVTEMARIRKFHSDRHARERLCD